MTTRYWLTAGTALLSVSLAAPVALAQAAPKPLPPAPPEVMEPPNENPAPPTDPSTGAEAPEKPFSKELKENEGVLEPPRSVDPGIEKKPPEDFEGRTPVIPPPGEPGGQPDVEPK